VCFNVLISGWGLLTFQDILTPKFCAIFVLGFPALTSYTNRTSVLFPARLFSISTSSTIPLMVVTAQTLRSRKAVPFIVTAVRNSDQILGTQILFFSL
jgi:hypothetical protein